jgi:hypothetical protein
MSRARRVLLSLLAAAAAGACAPEEPAMVVGDLGFAPEEVAALDEGRREVLADVAALGLAVRGRRTPALVVPLAERQAMRKALDLFAFQRAAVERGLDEAALREAYAEEPEWELVVRHVIRRAERGTSAEQRREALAVAQGVRRRALAGEDFAALAARYSEEPGADRRGGLLEPGRRGSWVEPFWEAAAHLTPGEVSEVVETRFGYHVILLEERRAVPFAEADRAPILLRLISTQEAREAMERWVDTEAPVILLDPPVLSRAREAVMAGGAPDTLVIAHWADGRYTARDLALARAELDPQERIRLERGDEFSYGLWVETDAREVAWGRTAARQVRPPRGTLEEATRRWQGELLALAGTLGLREDQGAEQIRDAARRAVGATGQEARIAVLRLEGMRSLLRLSYPVYGSSAPPSEAWSRSETPNSESTR